MSDKENLKKMGIEIFNREVQLSKKNRLDCGNYISRNEWCILLKGVELCKKDIKGKARDNMIQKDWNLISDNLIAKINYQLQAYFIIEQ